MCVHVCVSVCVCVCVCVRVVELSILYFKNAPEFLVQYSNIVSKICFVLF